MTADASSTLVVSPARAASIPKVMIPGAKEESCFTSKEQAVLILVQVGTMPAGIWMAHLQDPRQRESWVHRPQGAMMDRRKSMAKLTIGPKLVLLCAAECHILKLESLNQLLKKSNAYLNHLFLKSNKKYVTSV